MNLQNGASSPSRSHRDSEARQERTTRRYTLYERQYGSFTPCSFALPDVADGDRIDAKLDVGVLTLAIPKRAEAKPKKISIKK